MRQTIKVLVSLMPLVLGCELGAPPRQQEGFGLSLKQEIDSTPDMLVVCACSNPPGSKIISNFCLPADSQCNSVEYGCSAQAPGGPVKKYPCTLQIQFF
jgi:hypothetical protein